MLCAKKVINLLSIIPMPGSLYLRSRVMAHSPQLCVSLSCSKFLIQRGCIFSPGSCFPQHISCSAHPPSRFRKHLSIIQILLSYPCLHSLFSTNPSYSALKSWPYQIRCFRPHQLDSRPLVPLPKLCRYLSFPAFGQYP